MLEVVPHLVSNDGVRALHRAIADPTRFAIEPKIDGVRGLIVGNARVAGDGGTGPISPQRDWGRTIRPCLIASAKSRSFS
jgi:hypothetical protein